MKSATAKEYIESVAAQKAATLRLKAAKAAVVEDVKQLVVKAVANLLPTYPQLAYVVPSTLVDTKFNTARKRPKLESGPLFFHFSVNPYWNVHNLSRQEATEISTSFHSHHDQVVLEIIRQVEAAGEWKLVEGSIFRYDDGPRLNGFSDWAMLPV